MTTAERMAKAQVFLSELDGRDIGPDGLIELEVDTELMRHAASVAPDASTSDKLKALRAVAKAAESREAACKSEADQLKARANASRRVAERCKALAVRLMLDHEQRTGQAKLDTDTFSFRLQASPPRLVLPDDPDRWPAVVKGFVTMVPKLDKRALLDKVKQDEEAWAKEGVLLRSGRHLRWDR